jgi:hypothetical protein
MTQDEQHLDLLAVFHYVLGGLTALFACFPLIHVAVGLGMVLGAFDEGLNPPPEFFGWIFVVAGSVFVLAGWTLACLIIVTGRMLHRRQARMFCMVLAGIECLFMPPGTVLGVFTIIVLSKESVRNLFLANQHREPAISGEFDHHV